MNKQGKCRQKYDMGEREKKTTLHTKVDSNKQHEIHKFHVLEGLINALLKCEYTVYRNNEIYFRGV